MTEPKKNYEMGLNACGIGSMEKNQIRLSIQLDVHFERVSFPLFPYTRHKRQMK
jgi:hypothetical protein